MEYPEYNAALAEGSSKGCINPLNWVVNPETAAALVKSPVALIKCRSRLRHLALLFLNHICKIKQRKLLKKCIRFVSSAAALLCYCCRKLMEMKRLHHNKSNLCNPLVIQSVEWYISSKTNLHFALTFIIFHFLCTLQKIHARWRLLQN